MGDLKKSNTGRLNPFLMTSSRKEEEGQVPALLSASYALRRSVRPVSLATRAVLRRRSTGAYVSRLKHRTADENAPQAIIKIQNTQRQPIDSPMNPPHRGPIAGPIRAPEPQMDAAKPRFSTGKRSAITPAPMATGPTPPTPVSSRNTMREALFGARAHPICHTTNHQLAQLKTIRRPYISLKGASNSGPNYTE